MASKTPLQWKLEGDSHIENKEYRKAVECYDMSLRLTRDFGHASILLVCRSSARLSLHAYDAALNDASTALELPIVSEVPSEENERARMITAKAFYGLRQFSKCAECLDKLAQGYAMTEERRMLFDRCQVRLGEEKGVYDWGSMLEEARHKKGNMDRADYVGGMELRLCADEACGKGLFTTRDVEAGELLLCEKAFAAAFAKEGVDKSDLKEVTRVRVKLATRTFARLCQNPSLQSGFGELYAGPQTGDEVFDDMFIRNRINYNAFAFPLLTSASHQRIVSRPPHTPTTAENRGIWIRASFINHSCYPLIRRSFIGDMMIFRAHGDIPKDTELRFGYVPCFENIEKRTELLANYGFRCECQVCVAERATPRQELERRKEVMDQIMDVFKKGEAVSFPTCLELLRRIGATYTVSPTLEPRYAVIIPIMRLIMGCESSSLHAHVIHLVQLFLSSLGFEFTVTRDSFRVRKWGFLMDELVMALAKMRDAYAALGQLPLTRDAEGIAKKCYLIMCGEEISWQTAYGTQSVVKSGSDDSTHDE